MIRLFTTLFLIAFAAACGPTAYTVHVVRASRAVSHAEQVGAPTHSPYEYYRAVEYLRKAREEAGEASYEDAIDFARTANEAAQEAQERTREQLRQGVEQ